jgi:acetyl-CoA carboxylase biotin carboxyl carrier protein
MAETPNRKKSSKGATSEGMTPLSIADIKELFTLMRDNEIAELQLEQQETRIHIVSKGAHTAPAPQVVPLVTGMPSMGMVGMQPHVTGHATAPQVASPPAEASTAAAVEASGSAEASSPSNLKTIYSPMVGTFYSAPAPDAPTFVRVGESVNEDTVLCIIEAMKLMNEIKAETKGRIYKMLVENGNPVEYNQPLFLIEP